MLTKMKISPFQLFCLLVVGRLFTLLLWSPVLPQAGSLLLAIVLGPFVQFLLALLLCWFFRQYVWDGKSRFVHKGILAVCWLGCMVTAALAAGSSGVFLSGAFYGGKYSVTLIVILLAGAALAAFLGLEATARTAPVALLAILAALAALLAGAAGELHLAYLPAPVATPMDTTRLLLYSTCTNWELLVLPLLTPYCTKPMKKRAIAAWLGLMACIQLAVALAVMLCLGYYAVGQPYPVYTLARSARLPVAERLDALLMGIWVVLGFLKCTLAIYLAGELWGRLFGPWSMGLPSKRLRRPMLHGLAACLAALLLLSGCSQREAVGRKTIATMLELSYRDGICTARVEYRQPGQKEQPTQYGVYEAQGETLAQALAAMQSRESITLWLESCRVACITGEYDHATLGWLLEQLAARRDLRPLTNLVLAQKEMLSPQQPQETTTAGQLSALFYRKGGQLSDRFALKDAVGRLRDPQLAVLLPEVEADDNGPVLAGFFAMDEAGQGRLTVEEAQVLSLGLLEGRQPLQQPDGLTVTGVYGTLWGGYNDLTVGVWPVGVQEGPGDEQAEDLLSQRCQTTAAELFQKMQEQGFPDIFDVKKYLVLRQPSLWKQQGQYLPDLLKSTTVKIVVKPLISQQ